MRPAVGEEIVGYRIQNNEDSGICCGIKIIRTVDSGTACQRHTKYVLGKLSARPWLPWWALATLLGPGVV